MFVNESGGNEQSLQRPFHRCFLSSFGSFGQAVSEEKILKNQPIRNKNCLWQPYLLMDQDEMSKLYRGPSIDTFYQVSVHLTKGFHRGRLKCEKLMDDRRQMSSDGKNSHCLWQCEIKMKMWKKGNTRQQLMTSDIKIEYGHWSDELVNVSATSFIHNTSNYTYPETLRP